MGKQLGSLIDRKIFLRKINVEEIINNFDEEDVNYKLNVAYKIVENNDGVVNIKVKVNSNFIPDFLFKAAMDFNVIVEYEKKVDNKDIIENIGDIIYPIGSEVSYLLSTITKSMSDMPLILPPVIDNIKLIEE